MRFEQQLKSFLRILNEYPENTPLNKFLPAFFKQNRQMGSTDRRVATRLIYNYYRLGNACSHLRPENRLFLAEYLCTSGESAFLKHFRPDLYETGEASLDEKISILGTREKFILEETFPFTAHLSAGIDKQSFLKSFFTQPDLFIRIYPGKSTFVTGRLKEAEVPFRRIDDHSLALDNGTKLDQLFQEDRPFEVQDLSSQRTARYFKAHPGEYWWDACAASGGKSLSLFHAEPDIKLVVSDIRESVLNNLDERFNRAGLHRFQKKVLDLTHNIDQELHSYRFDGVILDVPCSGSGTWGRTPEMITQFHERKITQFQRLQRTIASNVTKYIKPNCPLIYITCSVFKEENEDVVQFLASEFNLKLEAQQVLTGYTEHADTMFAARLIKADNP